MSEKAKQLIVGLFVLVGVVAFVFLSFAITTKEPMLERSGYSISGEFDDVTGMVRLNPIRISGVLVGRITKVELSPKNKARLTLYLYDKNLKLPDDSTLSIQTEGLLGQRYVRISPGNSTVYLKEGDEVTRTRSAVVLEDLIGQAIGLSEEPQVIGGGVTYTADFTKTDGLIEGDYVYEKGVPVGKVADIKLEDESVKITLFFFKDSFRMNKKDKLHIRSSGLLGGRLIEIVRDGMESDSLEPGAHIEISKTKPPFTLDGLIMKALSALKP